MQLIHVVDLSLLPTCQLCGLRFKVGSSFSGDGCGRAARDGCSAIAVGGGGTPGRGSGTVTCRQRRRRRRLARTLFQGPLQVQPLLLMLADQLLGLEHALLVGGRGERVNVHRRRGPALRSKRR